MPSIDRDADRRGLLAQLDQLLLHAPPLVPLAEERFLETHVLYEGRSDQQRRIIDWFGRRFGPRVPGDRPYRVLSVGCGSGILDVPVAASLAEASPALQYVGVDPNAVECEAFASRFAEAGVDAELSVVAEPFEVFEDEAGFDLVHLVHCLYYLPDPGAALERARSFVRSGGALVLVHAPCGELNELSTRFYDKAYGRPTLFADDCADQMRRLGWRSERSRIDARVDVTPLVDGDAATALALRDFIVQFDFRQLPSDVQALVDRYLALVSQPTPDGAVYIDHPVDVFVIAES